MVSIPIPQPLQRLWIPEFAYSRSQQTLISNTSTFCSGTPAEATASLDLVLVGLQRRFVCLTKSQQEWYSRPK